MSIRELDSVVLEHDLPEHGLRKGDLGAVVAVHSIDSFDVEFVRVSGDTQALVSLSRSISGPSPTVICPLFAPSLGAVPPNER